MNGSTISLRIKENLLFLTKKHNISEAELCRRANLPQATINRLLKGVTDDPRASTLKSIADFFNITVDQLLSSRLIKDSTHETTRLPIYYMDQENLPISKLKSIHEIDWTVLLAKKEESFLEVESSISPKCLAIEVKGDSMWPQFIEGTFVIVDPTIPAKNRDFVVYLLENSNNMVLRQYIEEQRDRILKPLNYAYKSTQINKNDIFVGTVIQAKSDFR